MTGKDERRVLTRESIAEKLVYEAKRQLVGCAMVFALGVIVFGMMFFALGLAKGTEVPRVAVAVFFFGLAVYCAWVFIRQISRIGKAKRGEFSIHQDVLESVSDDRPNIWNILLSRRWFDQTNFEHIFVFKSGKRFVANSGESKNTSIDATARFSIAGDTFILVSYYDAPEKIIFIFSEKLYCYKK